MTQEITNMMHKRKIRSTDETHPVSCPQIKPKYNYHNISKKKKKLDAQEK